MLWPFFCGENGGKILEHLGKSMGKSGKSRHKNRRQIDGNMMISAWICVASNKTQTDSVFFCLTKPNLGI